MNRQELVKSVIGKIPGAGYTPDFAGLFVGATLAVIKEAIGRGESVKIPGFGAFIHKTRKARIGRNPRTGEAVAVPERHGVRFKPSPDFMRP